MIVMASVVPAIRVIGPLAIAAGSLRHGVRVALPVGRAQPPTC